MSDTTLPSSVSLPATSSHRSDLFGVKQAGAIHGRVLTAWSAAAVVGPYMLNSIREGEYTNSP